MRTVQEWRRVITPNEVLSGGYYQMVDKLEAVFAYMQELEKQVVLQRHELSEANQWIAELKRQLDVLEAALAQRSQA